MNETRADHLTISVAKTVHENKAEFINEVFLIKEDKRFDMKSLKKLHSIFGHPSPEKLVILLKDSGERSPVVMKLLRRIQSCCKICSKYKCRLTKPKVALPKAR